MVDYSPGWLLDTTGSYAAPMWISSGLDIIGSLLLIVVMIRHKKKHNTSMTVKATLKN